MKKSECVETLRKRGYDCEEEGSVVIVYGETDEKAIRRVLSEIGYKASFGISSRTRKTEKDEERVGISDDEEMMPEIEDDKPAVEESAVEAESSIEEVEEQMDIFRVNDAHQTSIFDFL